MKYFTIIIMSLMLAGCSSAMTRLLPKMEKIDLPEELMVPAKELKIIVKPEPSTNTSQAELERNVPPQ